MLGLDGGRLTACRKVLPMSSDVAIRINQLGKHYRLYAKPLHRLWEALGMNMHSQKFTALEGIDFEVKRGEVVGIVGRNGAGKSTLLQLICGTLQPSCGSIEVHGRVAALLELGAGFNPEFSGRENVFMNAAVLGLTQNEIEAKYEAIVEFAELAAFMDQPVKTYSSGMLVRLAFAVATSVEPDILVIDEALSVGDGVFAKKSFDRIMQLRDAGTTILFCSHALYQIEALCNRALWLHQGKQRAFATTTLVTQAYQDFLTQLSSQQNDDIKPVNRASNSNDVSTVRLITCRVCVDKECGTNLNAISELSELSVAIECWVATSVSTPTVAIVISDNQQQAVTSCSTLIDGISLKVNDQGLLKTTLSLPKLPLLKGSYHLHVFLLCEKGVHVYEHAANVASIEVTQPHLAQGVCMIPRRWSSE